jgi:hypothetical protein
MDTVEVWGSTPVTVNQRKKPGGRAARFAVLIK